MTAYINKEEWSKYVNWCFENIDNINSWYFNDGPCRITFKDTKDRMLFALVWGV